MKYKRKIKNISKRALYKKVEVVQRIIKTLCFSFNNNFLYFVLLNGAFIPSNNKHFKTHIKNFCIVSGRSRAIHKKFKVSRILLRKLSSKGYFFGLKKAS
jgi:ribosomal protein S14